MISATFDALRTFRPRERDKKHFWSPVQRILCDCYQSIDRERFDQLAVKLEGSLAGEWLDAMREHHAIREAKRIQREAFENPEATAARRAKRAGERQAKHQARIAKYRELGKEWLKKNGGR